MEQENESCSCCSSIIADNEIPLQENYRLAIDLDVSIVNPLADKSPNRKGRKQARDTKIKELLRKVSALRNAGGGALFVHFHGKSESDWCQAYFHEYVDEALTKLIEDGVLFVDTYHKFWLFDITQKEKHSNFLLLTVKSSLTLTTADFKTKVTSDENVTGPTTLNLHNLLFHQRPIQNKPPTFRGLTPVLPQESRNIQFKSIDKTQYSSGVNGANLTDVVAYVWKELRLREYIASFTKVHGGGSYFLGIGEDDIKVDDCIYKTKRPDRSGVIIPRNLHEQFIEQLKKVIAENIFIYSNYKTDITSLVDARFHELNQERSLYILEVAVGCISGCVFYDRSGPEAYTICEHDGKMVKLMFAEWLTKVRGFISFEPARRSARKVTVTWPSSSPFRRRIKQSEGAFDDIRNYVLKTGQLTVYPPTMSEYGGIQEDLRRRLEENGRLFSLGLAYIIKSLVVLLNLPKTNIPSGHVCEVFYASPNRPSMILCVVDRKYKDLKNYVLWLAQKTICHIRKYSDEHFSAVYGLLDKDDLSSMDKFKQTLKKIETETSVLCNPDSLVMNEQKCTNIMTGFLAAIAVTDLAPLAEGRSAQTDELNFLSKQQFCIFVENIDKNMAIINKSSSFLMAEVARRLEKKGETILAADEDLKENLLCGNPKIISHVVLPEEFSDYCRNVDLSNLQHVVATDVETDDISFLRTSHNRLVVWLFNNGEDKNTAMHYEPPAVDIPEGMVQEPDSYSLPYGEESDEENDEGELSRSKNEEGYFTDDSWELEKEENKECPMRQDSTQDEKMLKCSLEKIMEEIANTVPSHLIRTVKKCLKDNNVATIVGRPGEGKTTLACQVLAQLHREHWKIYIVNNPKDFFRIKRSEKYIVYLKDIFGTTNFSFDSYQGWTPVLSEIQRKMFQCNPLHSMMYALFTCRENVFHEVLQHAPAYTHNVVGKTSIIDVKQDEVLDEPEKEPILQRSGRDTFGAGHVSPLLCKLSTSSLWEEFAPVANTEDSDADDRMLGFFQNLIGHTYNLAILKILVHQGSLPDLTVLSNVQLESVCKAAGAPRVRTKQMIDAVAKMNGEILRASRNGYIFSHTLISELVARVLATHDTAWFIQQSGLHHLQYVDIRPKEPAVTSKYVIYIEPEMADSLGQRLCTELLKEHVHFVLSHPSLKHQSVRNPIHTTLKNDETYRIRDTKTGELLLHLLPINDHLNIQPELLEMKPKDVFRCLRTCCEYSNVTLLRKVVEKNQDLFRTNQRKGARLLTMCARRGNTDGCKELLGYINVSSASTSGNTVLHHAASTGNLELLTLLSKTKGVNIDIQNKRKETALARAIYCVQEPAARELMDCGANTKIRDENGRTCFMIAAAAGSLALLKDLFKLSGDLHATDNMGNTALHLTAVRGKVETAKFLIQKGTDIHSVNKENLTPLHLAARSGKHLLIDLLFTQEKKQSRNGQKFGRSTSFESKDGHRMTAVHYAAKLGHDLVIGRLLQHHCNVNETNEDGQTPLHLAVTEGYGQIAKTLVDNGANPNLSDKSGRTPLHYAAEEGYLKVVKFLLKANADASKPDAKGMTALDLASEVKHKDVVQVLQKVKLKTKMKTSDDVYDGLQDKDDFLDFSLPAILISRANVITILSICALFFTLLVSFMSMLGP